MSLSTKGNNIYYPELDGLRFFAFLAVFIHHSLLASNTPFWVSLNQHGWMGVDLFFCLSAFLFTKLLFVEYQAKGDINVKNFYIRRALRIWPLYFVFVVAVLVLNFGWSGILTQRTLGLFTFTDDILTAYLFTYNGIVGLAHLWTISYEEQFYAIIPWFLRKMFKVSYTVKVWVLISIFFTFTLIRAIMIYYRVPHPAVWVLPVTHFEGILGGLVVGLGLVDEYLKKIPGWLIMTAGLGTLILVTKLPNVFTIGWNLMLTYPLVGLGMTLILFSVVKEGSWSIKNLLQTRLLTYLGKISYGLYVYHLLAINYAAQFTLDLGISSDRLIVYPKIVFGMGLCITILVSAASYQLLEKPFLRLKAKFTSIESRPI